VHPKIACLVPDDISDVTDHSAGLRRFCTAWLVSEDALVIAPGPVTSWPSS